MTEEQKKQLNPTGETPEDAGMVDEEIEAEKLKDETIEPEPQELEYQQPAGKDFNKKYIKIGAIIFSGALVIGLIFGTGQKEEQKKQAEEQVDIPTHQVSIQNTIDKELSKKEDKNKPKEEPKMIQPPNQVKPLNPVVPYVDSRKYEQYRNFTPTSTTQPQIMQQQKEDIIGFFNLSQAQAQQQQTQGQQGQGQGQAQQQQQYDQNQQLELKAGSVIPGVLITGLNSDLPGEIVGQVSQNVYDTVTGDYLLIPQGTRVIGTYDSSTSYNQERILIAWTRLIFPNGLSVALNNMGASDVSGYAGLADKVNKHENRLIGAALLTSVLAAGAQIAAGNNQGGGSILNNQTNQQLAVSGAAQAISGVGQQLIQKDLGIQPTITVSPGFRFNIIVNKDMILMEYQ